MIEQEASEPTVAQGGVPLVDGRLSRLAKSAAGFAFDEFRGWTYDLAAGFQPAQDVVQPLHGSSTLDPKGHSHGSQGRPVPRADGCVVIADDTDIFGNAYAQPFERCHQMDGRRKARSGYCSRPSRPRANFCGDPHEVQPIEVAFEEHVRRDRKTALFQSIAKRIPTSACNIGIGLDTDKADPAMTEVGQIVGLSAKSGFIVEANVTLTNRIVTVQRYKGEICAAKFGDEGFVRQVMEHHSVKPPLMGQVDERFSGRLSRRIAVEKQAESQFFRFLLRAVDDFWIDVSSGVADREYDGSRSAGLQPLCQHIWAVVQRFGRFKDFRSLSIRYANLPPVNHPRHGRNIDSTLGRDVLEGDHLTHYKRFSARLRQIETLSLPH